MGTVTMALGQQHRTDLNVTLTPCIYFSANLMEPDEVRPYLKKSEMDTFIK